jgi:formylmethanofuran dehydrogenase subunit B
MMNDFGDSKVTIKKPELLAAIIKNRAAHQAEYEEAEVGYRAAAIKALSSMLKEAKAGGTIRKTLDLVEPVSHTKDYDRVIRMLEMSTADEVSITETQFSQYVLDEWAWTALFKVSNARYR